MPEGSGNENQPGLPPATTRSNAASKALISDSRPYSFSWNQQPIRNVMFGKAKIRRCAGAFPIQSDSAAVTLEPAAADKRSSAVWATTS